MSVELSVASGEVRACRGACLLRASAIGSCVVVAACDVAEGAGGMAHVMLPGAAAGPDTPDRPRTRYAADALERLLESLADLGAGQRDGWAVCLVGGANVLGPEHASPGPEIVASLDALLQRAGLTVVARDTGGTERRSCQLDVAVGRVAYTLGDGPLKTLWEAARPGERTPAGVV